MRKPKIPPEKTNMELLKDEKKSKELFGYMIDEEINAFIKDMNDRYIHWDELVYRTPPKNASLPLIWNLMKFNRNSIAKKIKIGSFQFKFNITDLIQYQLHQFDMNLGGSLGVTQDIPSEEKNRYLISSLMEEAIASSQLEGAATTRKVAKEMLRKARKPRDKSEKMIMNNYLTSKFIKNSEVKKLTPEFIFEIHKNITQDTLDNDMYAGKFRDTNDIFVIDTVSGEIAHEPPDFNLLKELIDRLCDFANKEDSYFMHPIIKASILHFLIGYIHPFVDGNGRTARALFYWYLIKEGYWIVEFMSISRVIIKSPIKYSRAYLYTESDENDLTYFLNYQLRTIKIALEELRRHIVKKSKNQKEFFKIVEKTEDINIRQADIIHEFYTNEHKSITIKEVQEVFDIVYETARKDLLELEEKGFLKKKTIGKKQFIFLRSNNFNKIMNKIIKD